MLKINKNAGLTNRKDETPEHHFVQMSDISDWFFGDNQTLSYSNIICELATAPQAINYTIANKFADSDIYKSQIHREYIGGNSISTLTMTGVLTQLWSGKHTIEPMLEKIAALTVPSGKYNHPPVLGLIFGNRRFYPYCLLECSVDENNWINGQPSGINCDLTFVKMLKSEETIIKDTSLKLFSKDSLKEMLTGDKLNLKVIDGLKKLSRTSNGDLALPASTNSPPFTPREVTEAIAAVPSSDLEAAKIDNVPLKRLLRNDSIAIDLSSGIIAKV